MDLQELINKAWELKKQGNLAGALSAYDSIYDMLISEANKYARNVEGAFVDIGKTRSIAPKFFNESKNYLKRERVACVVANNMGTIFVELGNFEKAKKMFGDAIEFTPDDFSYKDPHIALEQLNKK